MSTGWRGSIVLMSIVVMSLVALLGSRSRITTSEQTPEPYKPSVFQPGKDVPWVPSPQQLVDRMLDMAHVTANDSLVDLGSGDGIVVISAARRGARAHGIEYNPDLVELARKKAAAAGVGRRATFTNADIFESDFSDATVVTMFLLQSLNLKLRPTILGLKPGTRVVSNTFHMGDWEPDARVTMAAKCDSWCSALMWIVPARVEGVWRLGPQELLLRQHYQQLSGSLGSSVLTGKLRGNSIRFTAAGTVYSGKVSGSAMRGTTADGRAWNAAARN
jgi:hypothetical protein